MSKCACCHERDRTMTWQPFGPSESSVSFTVPGSHYRGFPAIGICDECMADVKAGVPGVVFTYKHVGYVALRGTVEQTPF